MTRTMASNTTCSFIDGRSVGSSDSYDNIDPATGTSLGPVARAGPAEVDRAVQSAKKVQPAWDRTRPEERARLLGRLADIIDRHPLRADHSARAELARLHSTGALRGSGIHPRVELPHAAPCPRGRAGDSRR